MPFGVGYKRLIGSRGNVASGRTIDAQPLAFAIEAYFFAGAAGVAGTAFVVVFAGATSFLTAFL
jgi:hypothetical protein